MKKDLRSFHGNEIPKVLKAVKETGECLKEAVCPVN